MKPSHYLYIIECQGFFKIGISSSPIERLKTISTSTPFDVHVVHLIGFESKKEVLIAESLAHEQLTSLGYHERLEWFNCDKDLAISTCTVAEERAKNICALKRSGVKRRASHFAKLFDQEKLSEIACIPISRVSEIADGDEPTYHEALLIMKIKESI